MILHMGKDFVVIMAASTRVVVIVVVVTVTLCVVFLPWWYWVVAGDVVVLELQAAGVPVTVNYPGHYSSRTLDSVRVQR